MKPGKNRVPYGTWRHVSEEVKKVYFKYGVKDDEDWEDLPEIDLRPPVPDLEEHMHSIECVEIARHLVAGLATNDALLLRLRYGLWGGEEYSRKEVAEMFHVPLDVFKLLENRAIRKFKQPDRWSRLNDLFATP